jgi:plasmid stabilization system protein ParE
MKRYRVELSPEALEQGQAIRAWWIENRPAAPDLFADELGAAIRKLGAVPRVGAPYEATTLREMRRVLMSRTRYHVTTRSTTTPDSYAFMRSGTRRAGRVRPDTIAVTVFFDPGSNYGKGFNNYAEVHTYRVP